jgi:hypothetical protein
MKSLWMSVTALACLAAPSIAMADEPNEPIGGARHSIGEWSSEPEFVASPESFTLELRAGTYRPDLGPSFAATFCGDLGPLIAVELDYHLLRIPYVGPIIIGARVGWVEWNGAARAADGNTDVGDTGMSLVPITALVGVRINGLARHLRFPLIITPKFGLDMGYYQTGTSGATQQDGWSVGLSYGAQLALELDFLDVRAARRLDEEWGINHSEIFFELYGSTMGSFSDRQIPLGTGLAWAAGLGFTF